MAEKIDSPKTSKIAANIQKPTDTKANSNMVTDLNIVLSKEQIKKILHDLAEINAFDASMKALFSDYCCVDVAVGSSVAGPASSVGTSVSVETSARTAQIKQRLNAEQINVDISVPRDVQIR